MRIERRLTCTEFTFSATGLEVVAITHEDTRVFMYVDSSLTPFPGPADPGGVSRLVERGLLNARQAL